ncbi:hypothetical protein [Mycolicibacterium frederiksbergense]|jgi:hypothetical protein|uniref:hypothetical protein n=1 Tax=Mycolicibacterium frederiksbergense TaxID=117567 RepID=UPI00399AC778
MSGEWSPRQSVLAILVAVVIGVIGGGAIHAATDRPDQNGGPGGFGPPGPPPRSLVR